MPVAEFAKLVFMCGRYRLTAKERYLAEHFEISDDEVRWTARYNIAPTQQVAIVRRQSATAKVSFALVRWGLIPAWAKDSSIANHTINAMSETAAEKPAFRDALQHRRCLVPADGFYEWKKFARGQKQPYSFSMADDGLFAFAGLWDRWRSPSGEEIESCTILTTTANLLLRGVHQRMPVILPKHEYAAWLDPARMNPRGLVHLLRPFDPTLMKAVPVRSTVNNVRNDSPECIQAAPAPPASTPGLFD
ncbi:MAG TPA: SOS response-associated peptidase [Candidatus Angelobacter sp.]|nr:SOS response-associated peptidase [Candidatus Angelobacter sp.]